MVVSVGGQLLGLCAGGVTEGLCGKGVVPKVAEGDEVLEAQVFRESEFVAVELWDRGGLWPL